MRIAILDIYYGDFIKAHYDAHPDLENEDYETQRQSLLSAQFGIGDGYETGFERAGHSAHTFIINCGQLQGAWDREHGSGSDETFMRQIEHYDPDVILAMGLWTITNDVRQAFPNKIIAGHVGSRLDEFATNRFDVIFTPIPRYVESFRNAGVRSEIHRCGFNHRALIDIDVVDRTNKAVFVGTRSGGHSKRDAVICELARLDLIDIYGMGWQGELGYRGEAFGMDTYRRLNEYTIGLNGHIDFAFPCVGNMRMFETTGMCALLITDTGSNMDDLFTVDDEVLVYESADEAVSLVRWAIENPVAAAGIALHGYYRTMNDHTYLIRAEEMISTFGGLR